MGDEKQVDEFWKESVQQQKDILINSGEEKADDQDSALHIPESIKKEDSKEEKKNDNESEEKKNNNKSEESSTGVEANFANYITSLGFQALIFLGEIPNPMTKEIDKNFDQAKFLIDTLVLLKEKTKGNLTEVEEKLLHSSVYELQIKYVECIRNNKGESVE